MVDRERVIYDIERCICHVPDACLDCSKYSGDVDFDPIPCMEDLLSDALVLLREQEPVQFKVTRQDKSYPFWDTVCTGCGYKTSTVKDYWKYCPVCGRAVKLECLES